MNEKMNELFEKIKSDLKTYKLRETIFDDLMVYFSHSKINLEEFYDLKDSLNKELINKNLVFHREFSQLSEDINRSFFIAKNKNNTQVESLRDLTKQEIKSLKMELTKRRKKFNTIISKEQESFNQVILENRKIYDDEIKEIDLELKAASAQAKVKIQRLENERDNKLSLILENYTKEREKLEAEIRVLTEKKQEDIKKIETSLEEQLKTKDESYLVIKKNHTQTSINLNDFINNEKLILKKNLTKIAENESTSLSNLNILSDELKVRYKEKLDSIQNEYIEKIKALNIVFDVQKEGYKKKSIVINGDNNERVTEINRQLREKKEKLTLDIKNFEKKAFNSDTLEKKEIHLKIKALNHELYLLILKTKKDLNTQEILFQKQLFEHDYQHVKEINEWRYSKNLYDKQRKIYILNEEITYKNELKKLEVEADYIRKISTIKNNIANENLIRTLLPIESQLQLATLVQTREINLLNLEFDSTKKIEQLEIEKMLNNYDLQESSINHTIALLELEYNKNVREINITYQLEIEKEIFSRDKQLKILELNISLQKSLMKKRDQRYYKIFSSTIETANIEIERLEENYDFQKKSLLKNEKIENEKRKSIVQEIKTKNQRILNKKRALKSIQISKNETEVQESLNIFFKNMILSLNLKIENALNYFFYIINEALHPEVIRTLNIIILEFLSELEDEVVSLIDTYNKLNNLEFDQRLFDLTDYKYRLKHEEILSIHNDNINVANETKNDLEEKHSIISLETTSLKSKIINAELLLKTNSKKDSELTFNNDQNKILSDEIFNSHETLKSNTSLLKTIESEIKVLNRSVLKHKKNLILEEEILVKEMKDEQEYYKLLHKKQKNSFTSMINVYRKYFIDLKKKILLLEANGYINQVATIGLNDKVNKLIKKNETTSLLLTNKIAEFWLNIHISTKKEQFDIINSFNKKADVAINQLKSSYTKFINVEKEEYELLKINHKAKLDYYSTSLKEISEKALNKVKETHVSYNNVYDDVEREITILNDNNKSKILVTSENLEAVLKKLNSKYEYDRMKLKKLNIAKSKEIISKNQKVSKDILEEKNSFALKSKATHSKHDSQRKMQLSKLKSNNQRINILLNKYSESIKNLNKELQDSKSNINKITSLKIRDNYITLKKFKYSSRIDQNRLTRKERNTLKKSYSFKSRQLKIKG